jgi:hypothetical protein
VGRGIRGRYRSESERSGEEESHSAINVRKRKGSTGPQGAAPALKNGTESHLSLSDELLPSIRTLKSTSELFSDTSTKNGKILLRMVLTSSFRI